MSSQTLAIETVRLTKHFGQHRDVDAITLAIPQDTVFGFLGPNVAGKTTTIRILLGRIKPSSGNGSITVTAFFSGSVICSALDTFRCLTREVGQWNY